MEDPLAGEIAERVGGREDAEPVVDAMLSMRQIFDEELAADTEWRALLVDLVDALTRDGAERTAREIAG